MKILPAIFVSILFFSVNVNAEQNYKAPTLEFLKTYSNTISTDTRNLLDMNKGLQGNDKDISLNFAKIGGSMLDIIATDSLLVYLHNNMVNAEDSKLVLRTLKLEIDITITRCNSEIEEINTLLVYTSNAALISEATHLRNDIIEFKSNISN